MKTELQIEGYTVRIAQDIFAENPFEAWDCEPPLLAYYDSGKNGFKAYNGAPETWREILHLLPDSIFERKNRVAFLRRFVLFPGESIREFTQNARNAGIYDLRDAMAENLIARYEGSPHGWSNAIEWLETAAAILEYGGIACHYTQSNGYSQGDSTLLLAIATPAWIELTGAPADSHARQLEAACELHGAWQWGDVYGIASIHAPGPLDDDGEETEGEEIEDASVWGFYGSDHEKSGFLESARESIRHHKEQQAKESASLVSALCSLE